MGKKYQEKKPTGREYVDVTTKFCNYTVTRCSALPARWASSILDPLIRDVNDIERYVRQANKVYLSKDALPETKLKAYTERSEYLKQAISIFSDFDIKFDRLMSNIDIAGHERKRLKQIIENIIQQEQENNPSVANININVVSKFDEVQYVSLYGNQTYKLKLTTRQRDYWLSLEKESKDLIAARYRADKKAISGLCSRDRAEN